MPYQLFTEPGSLSCKFYEGWSEADLDEIIQKFAPNAIVTETEQKINYQNPNSPFIVVVDKSGDYFRIMNTSMPGKKDKSKYVDLNGKNVHNEVVKGKIRGRSREEWKRITHFKIKKKGGN